MFTSYFKTKIIFIEFIPKCVNVIIMSAGYSDLLYGISYLFLCYLYGLNMFMYGKQSLVLELKSTKSL